MEKQKSLKKNAIYGFIRALMNLMFPLVSFPYASRVLLPEGIGKVQFANSIIFYFTFLAGLGISTYASREAARIRDNKDAFNTFCKEIFIINLISTFVSYVALAILIFIIPKFWEFRILLIICSTQILFITIGMEYIYSAQEDYGYITRRSIVFQIISLFFLFTFIKDKDDYTAYAFFGVISSVGSNICNLFYSRKYINLFTKCQLNFKKHLKPIFVFFATAVATKFHGTLDAMMLGFMLGSSEVGIYSAAEKINVLVKGLITSTIGTFMPRSSYYVEQNKNTEYKKLIEKTSGLALFFSIPSMAGIIILSRPIILCFCGFEYLDAIPVIIVLSTVIFSISFGSVLNNLIIIPQKMEKIILQAQILASIMNLILNYMLIPNLRALGAGLATAIIEFFVFFYKFIFCIKYLKNCNILRTLIKNIASASVMSISVFFILQIFKNVFLQIAISVPIGIIIYMGTSLLLKTETAILILNTFKNKLKISIQENE